MPNQNSPTCSDDDFIGLFRELGARATADRIGVSVRAVYMRRRSLEAKYAQSLDSPNGHKLWLGRFPARFPIEIKSGIALVGSDCHYKMGYESVSHRAFCHLAKEFGNEVKLTCLNGDVADFPGISRHDKMGWEKRPSVKIELEAVDERISEIEDAAKNAQRIWTWGNHDMRFNAKLAKTSGEYEDVKGFALQDHFPRWKFVISTWLNDDTVIKHRFKGGIHATHNNTLWSGKTMVTGHLHSLKVTPFDDYNGTRWGVDTGTMNDPNGDHADYNEDNPLNHREGFAVLTFHKGRLLWPELVHVFDSHHVEFRGKIIKV